MLEQSKPHTAVQEEEAQSVVSLTGSDGNEGCQTQVQTKLDGLVGDDDHTRS